MEPLQEELVEETWQEVAGLSMEEGSEAMIRLAKNQPELMAFIVELTSNLEQEVKELAIYLFFVVYRMFEKGYGDSISNISSKEIINGYEENEKLMTSMEFSHKKFYDRIASVQISTQPNVMRYIVEALFESPEEDDPVNLSESDSGLLFLLLKNVSDVLSSRLDE